MRRGLALLSFFLLLALLLVAGNPARETLRRVRFLARYGSSDLAVRRLAGSSAAFDRRLFFFLESARRRLPPRVAGVAVYPPRASPDFRNLAGYQLAPLPVRISPPAVPPGWIAAVYGPGRPAGWRQIAPISDGALLAPGP